MIAVSTKIVHNRTAVVLFMINVIGLVGTILLLSTIDQKRFHCTFYSPLHRIDSQATTSDTDHSVQ